MSSARRQQVAQYGPMAFWRFGASGLASGAQIEEELEGCSRGEFEEKANAEIEEGYDEGGSDITDDIAGSQEGGNGQPGQAQQDEAKKGRPA